MVIDICYWHDFTPLVERRPCRAKKSPFPWLSWRIIRENGPTHNEETLAM